MYSILDLLDFLVDAERADSVNRLAENLGVKKGGIRQKCRAVSQALRGDHEAFFEELLKTDLVALLEDPTKIGKRSWVLRNAAKYSKEELIAFALRLLVKESVPREFEEDDGDDEEEDKDDEEEDDEEEEEEEEEEDAEESDDEDDEDSSRDEQRAASRMLDRLGTPGDEWSRPRQIDRLLQACDIDVPQRLSSSRFRELLTLLSDLGLEACLADDDELTPLSSDADSPGISGKLRLRAKPAQARRRPASHQPSRVDLKPRRPVTEAPPAERSAPAVRLQPGEKLLASAPVRPDDYSLAVIRLQFLTAVPSVQRRTMQGWPDDHLAAATSGLGLRPEERQLLRALSFGLSIGNHSPFDSLPQLLVHLRDEELATLALDFVRLNPFQPEFVQTVLTQIGQHRPGTTAMMSPAQGGAVVPADRHPAPAPAATPTPPPHEAEPANRRELGALQFMFDDE